MKMTLAENVASLYGRVLSTEESNSLERFQQTYAIDDADPIIVVLAMLATNRLYMQELPTILQQKAVTTIELHQQTLRDQSSLIAKELVASVAQSIRAAAVRSEDRMLYSFVVFLAGVLTSAFYFYFRR